MARPGTQKAHKHGVCHGDIKLENVMITSWNWVVLADFASYKPTFLPEGLAANNQVSSCWLFVNKIIDMPWRVN